MLSIGHWASEFTKHNGLFDFDSATTPKPKLPRPRGEHEICSHEETLYTTITLPVASVWGYWIPISVARFFPPNIWQSVMDRIGQTWRQTKARRRKGD